MNVWVKSVSNEEILMNKELARYVAKTAFQSSEELYDLVLFLKEFCSENEYKAYATSVASAAFEIRTKILEQVFSEFPDLKVEFESNIEKYGKVL